MANQNLVQRIMDDAKKCVALGWSVEMFPNNCGHWTVGMKMQPSLTACPYVGRTIILDVNITWDYPKSPPTIHLKSAIYHPHFEQGSDLMGCNPKVYWHEQLDVIRSLQAVAYLLEAPYPRLSNTCGEFTCFKRAMLEESRAAFENNVKAFVRKAATFGINDKDAGEIAIRDAALDRADAISQALEKAAYRYQALVRDLPFTHESNCERRTRSIASKPMIETNITPGSTPNPPPQGPSTTDTDVNVRLKPVITKSASRSNRIEVSTEGDLASKRAKYCGPKILQLFLQPSNQSSRASVTARTTDTPALLRHYASDVSLAPVPKDHRKQSVRCMCNRELLPSKVWASLIWDEDDRPPSRLCHILCCSNYGYSMFKMVTRCMSQLASGVSAPYSTSR
eukprot:TRINITY_DN11013_c0_g5_i3.p1 TRINITY_DN11013_c0_g5~~TRINITY_DN11013_c0_g5_i3.p1  ORF type:complete len:395 (+),score=40.01 TRINITY_DN11013_c0_g5_i3:355-1539(+)